LDDEAIIDAREYINSYRSDDGVIEDYVSYKMPECFEEEEFVWQAEVRPRSGLAWKKGVTVLNSPGTIDNSYRGELKVIIVNHDDESFEIKKGDKIAQLIFTKSYILPIEEVTKFPEETKRGEKGFGSSGN
jgi:dUTP pyrophosphatase